VFFFLEGDEFSHFGKFFLGQNNSLFFTSEILLKTEITHKKPKNKIK
jgi:hypothetical protein